MFVDCGFIMIRFDLYMLDILHCYMLNVYDRFGKLYIILSCVMHTISMIYVFIIYTNVYFFMYRIICLIDVFVHTIA